MSLLNRVNQLFPAPFFKGNSETRRRRRSHQSNSGRALKHEKLDDRKLMAADIDVFAGRLQILGDSASDQITVSEVSLLGPQIKGASSKLTSAPMLRVSVTDRNTGASQQELFNASNIDRIVVSAGDGHDIIRNNTSLPSTLLGEGGYDRIYGGSADDVLYGQTGVDRLFGRQGNDTLYGGDLMDYLYGGSGDDELHGGASLDFLYGGLGDDQLFGDSGSDRMYGNAGDDQLVGGEGYDFYYGQSGNDSLIGGETRDAMNGGSGMDRFLILTGSQTVASDVGSSDVVIGFENTTTAQQVNLASNIGQRFAQPASWTESEVIAVDVAFEMLFDATNNNELLQKANGDELNFVRYGQLLDGDGKVDNGVLGWNGGDDIVVVDSAVGTWLLQTVIHEVAHNFDSSSENDTFNDFLAAGTWERRFLQSKVGWTKATQDNCNKYFRTDTISTFARTYGQMNPKEDFATSFAAKVLSDNGRFYIGDGGFESPTSIQSRMTARFDVLDDFFASLA